MAKDAELLEEFARAPAARAGQDAFTELVNRHLNLVYSAAWRQTRSPQLAEEVAQAAFTQLALHATTLRGGTILTAWLYQVSHRSAIDVVRREARRQAREQIACEMNQLQNQPAADWALIEPLLDEAVQALDETDRAAVLLRYFENKSLREVGGALGTSEDAAQKRVSRALARLREFFVKKGIATPATGLAGILSLNAVQTAPAGLALSIASGSLASAALTLSAATATSLTTAKIIAMTTMQKILVGAALAAAVVTIAYQHRQVSQLRDQSQTLAPDREAAWNQQVAQLQRERDQATNALALLKAENASLAKRPSDVLKLRNEVGKLRDEKAALGATTAISKMTATPEARQLLHDQQKAGMAVIYKQFAQQLKLTPDQSEKFNDLLADHVMQNVDDVTAALRDKTPPDQFSQFLAGENTALNQSIQDLVGADGLAQYQDYTKNLLASLTAMQFQDSLSGSDDEKTAKASQLRQAIEQQTQTALANANLPSDYQTVPILNFVNIASEDQADQNLKLLSGIYQQVASGAGSYLSPDEITKFQAFAAKAIANNTAALGMNRMLMAPLSSN